MPLDQTSQNLLAKLASANLPPLHESSPQQVRELRRAMRVPTNSPPVMARVEDFLIEHENGAYKARLLTPVEKSLGCIVYFHGGGWVLGDIDDFELMARHLAVQSQCAVLLIDYRLAPEHPFPAAVQDAYHAVTWAAKNMVSLTGGPVPLIVAGDSAGATLATVAARKAIEAGGPAITMQILVYPATDSDFSRPSYQDPANQLLLSADSMRWFWDHYLPDPSLRSNPDASPLRAPNLRGLAPAFVLTAEYDPLRDEGEAYATALLNAGVEVALTRKSGQMHGFFTMPDILPSSMGAIAEIGAAVSSRLRTVPPTTGS